MLANDLKKASLEEAIRNAIPIESEDQVFGSLVPVGPWILESLDLIGEMALWRANAMRMFLVQFESTTIKTRTYLKNLSIGRSDRILFLIEVDGVFLGHVGLAGITEDSAELDNLMRGRAGGPTDLMAASERTLIRWAFRDLGLKSLNLRILSYNIFAKSIHVEMGFQPSRSSPLRIVVREEMTLHEECSEDEATVKFTCDHMTLESRHFLAWRSEQGGVS